jgi:hypothetical protein
VGEGYARSRPGTVKPTARTIKEDPVGRRGRGDMDRPGRREGGPGGQRDRGGPGPGRGADRDRGRPEDRGNPTAELRDRMNERLDRVDERLDRLEEHVRQLLESRGN